MSFLQKKTLDGDVVQQKYGVIKTSIFKYITPTMIGVIITCIVLFTMNFKQIYVYYETSIPLNSLIFIVFLMAMIEAVNNNLNIYNVARFFKKMESHIGESVVDLADINKLKVMLETGAYLINIQNTFKLLENLEKHSHPLITDNDARLIKSKLGFRIRIQRSSVAFMGGLLVMLGLLGTFWGLLLTIGAVGDAMGTIAEQADTMGQEGGAGIGGIIESISAPLQGMGLAFSSSLFGLSGSLVVGFFNYACGQAQDKAIEDFSRWIDDQIPEKGSKEAKLLNASEVDKKDDVQQEKIAALEIIDNGSSGGASGFDQNFAGQIMLTIKNAAEIHDRLSDNFEKLLLSQKSIYEVLSKEYQEISEVKHLQQSVQENILDLAQSSKTTAETGKLIQHSIDQSVYVNSKIQEQLGADHELMEESFAVVHDDMVQLSAILGRIEQTMGGVDQSLGAIQQQEQKIVAEVAVIKDKIPQSEYEMIRRACSNISESIKGMDVSLQENARIMMDVAKEGNMSKMASILKDMQIVWLQMKAGKKNITGHDE